MMCGRRAWTVAVLVVAAVGSTLPGQKRKPQIGRATARGQPYVGVAVAPVPEALAAHLPELLAGGLGVIVTRVVPETPAARAGLRRHDILLRYGGRAVRTRADLARLIGASAAGQEVRLDVVRAGKALEVRLTPGRRPPGDLVRAARNPGLEIADAFVTTRRTGLGPLIIIGIAGNRLEVRVLYTDRDGRGHNRTATGSRQAILAALTDLPGDVLSEVKKRLAAVVSFQKGRVLASFRMRPFLGPGGRPKVHVSVSTLGKGGEVESIDFDAPPEVEAIVRRLRGLRGPVRERLEKALRKNGVPRIEMKTDESL